MVPKDTQYIPLSQHDIDEGIRDGFHSNSSTESTSPLATTNSFRPWEQVTCGVLLFLSVLFFVLWIVSVGAPMCTCVVKYFPANEAIEYVEHVQYQGGLRFTTPWRGNESGNPSLEVDATWRRISTDVKPIRITEEQLHKMGWK
ncbi:hypothetical protein JVU11DRAFT_2998 [Chiua virens]|nr:hypothetical protein JVU11DRAFT_2998 [Chiua virens]